MAKRKKKGIRMGDTKQALKPTSTQGTSVFDKLKDKIKGKNVSASNAAKNAADLMIELDTELGKLIAKKEIEVKTEAGREEYNQRTLARLKTMQFMTEQQMTLAAEIAHDS